MLRTLLPTQSFGLLGLLVTATLFPPAAQAAELGCITSGRPAASLLFPLFEVDLADAGGRTTLISIGNSSDQPALAHVVLWTNCDVPVLDFNLHLGPGALQPLDLRNVIGQGRIPDPAGELPPYADCPTAPPKAVLDEAALASLQARLTGAPDPDDGMCYAVPVEASRVATGYITVDVLNSCSDTIRTPLDEGYFASGGTGLASNANVLWGDFYFVDGKESSAQGFEAVALVADASAFEGPSFRPSFYGGFNFSITGDDRLPLSSRYRTRFLNGGGFDGGTELIVWTPPPVFRFFDVGGFPCEFGSQCRSVQFSAAARDEKGQSVSVETLTMKHNALRVAVGTEDLELPVGFGTVEVQLFETCGVCSSLGIYDFAIQGWVLPIYKASGRYSVGLSASRMDDFCADGNR